VDGARPGPDDRRALSVAKAHRVGSMRDGENPLQFTPTEDDLDNRAQKRLNRGKHLQGIARSSALARVVPPPSAQVAMSDEHAEERSRYVAGAAFEGTCALSNWRPNTETECRPPKSEVRIRSRTSRSEVRGRGQRLSGRVGLRRCNRESIARCESGCATDTRCTATNARSIEKMRTASRRIRRASSEMGTASSGTARASLGVMRASLEVIRAPLRVRMVTRGAARDARGTPRAPRRTRTAALACS